MNGDIGIVLEVGADRKKDGDLLFQGDSITTGALDFL